MTTMFASAPATPRSTGLLRGALIADGAFVALASLALLPFTEQASAATGIPQPIVLATALVMLPYALYLLWSTRDAAQARTAGRVAVVADIAWVVATIAVLALNIWPLTDLGFWVLVLGAVGVADLGLVTAWGLRRAARS